MGELNPHKELEFKFQPLDVIWFGSNSYKHPQIIYSKMEPLRVVAYSAAELRLKNWNAQGLIESIDSDELWVDAMTIERI